MQIRVIQHASYAGADSVATWAQIGGHDLRVTQRFRDDPIPKRERPDLVILLDDNASVHDDRWNSRLSDEKRYLERVIDRGVRVLGIGFGAQLTASMLGARVAPLAGPEIGWFPVTFRPSPSYVFSVAPEKLHVLHWHDSEFDLPSGAHHTAESEACPVQAFDFRGQVCGLQFHLELTTEGLTKRCGALQQELERDGDWVSTNHEIVSHVEYIGSCHRTLYALLNSFTTARASHE